MLKFRISVLFIGLFFMGLVEAAIYNINGLRYESNKELIIYNGKIAYADFTPFTGEPIGEKKPNATKVESFETIDTGFSRLSLSSSLDDIDKPLVISEQLIETKNIIYSQPSLSFPFRGGYIINPNIFVKTG